MRVLNIRCPKLQPIILTVAVLSLSGLCAAQNSQPISSAQVTTTNSDQSASTSQVDAALKNTVEAMGGSAAIYGLRNWTMQATSQSGSNGVSTVSQLTWKFSKGQFRSEVRVGDNLEVMVTGHGRPSLTKNGKTFPLSGQYANHRIFTPLSVAVMLSNAIHDQRCIKTSIGTAQLADGTAVSQSRLKCGLIVGLPEEQVWSFDPNTRLPLRIDYTSSGPDYRSPSVAAAILLSDFRVVQGVKCPYRLTVIHDGVVAETTVINSIDTTTLLLDTDFDAVAGGAR